METSKCGSDPVPESPLIMSSASLLDSREMTKIFGRIAAKRILLDIPGAGTRGMARCCHRGCRGCIYYRLYDNLSAERAKWVPTYSTRTLIDGRSETAPWAAIFDATEDTDKSLVGIDKEAGIFDATEDTDKSLVGINKDTDKSLVGIDKDTFRERLQRLPYKLSIGPWTSVPADEIPNDDSADTFWDILQAALIEIEDVDEESKDEESTSTYLLSAEKVHNVHVN